MNVNKLVHYPNMKLLFHLSCLFVAATTECQSFCSRRSSTESWVGAKNLYLFALAAAVIWKVY